MKARRPITPALSANAVAFPDIPSRSESPLISSGIEIVAGNTVAPRSEEHTSELQSHRDLHSFPTRRSSDLALSANAVAFPDIPSRSESPLISSGIEIVAGNTVAP